LILGRNRSAARSPKVAFFRALVALAQPLLGEGPMTIAALRVTDNLVPFAPSGRSAPEAASTRGTLKLVEAAEPSLAEPPDSSERQGDRTLSAYFRAVRRHQPLSREEEHAVAIRFVETGDPKLAARLVNANVRLVVKIALEYRTSRRHLGDLIQEGNFGLVHAVKKYDPRRGNRLCTYAAWWIRAYIRKFILSNARIVRLGTTETQRKLFFGMRRVQARLEANAGAEISPGDLAAAMSVPESAVVEMQRRLGSADASLDSPAHGGDDRGRGYDLGIEAPSAEDVLAERERRSLLKRAMHDFGRSLRGRDRVIFRRRLLCESPEKLARLADEFGVCDERARQLEMRLKAQLREHLQTTLGRALPDLGA
jgi:RNA polymerase sigma-32 factor